MIKNLVVVISGGALAFGFAGMVSPAMASASVAHPAGVTRANLPMPGGTPIIRDSNARPGHPCRVQIFNPGDPPVITRLRAFPAGGPGHINLSNPPDTPRVRGSVAHLRAQADTPTVRDSVAQNAPPTIRDAKARPGGAQCVKLTNPPGTPIIRDSTAKLGDPDDGGQVQVFAALSDPDDGGQ